MVNQDAITRTAEPLSATHLHEARAVRATVGAGTSGVQVDYVCRSCGARWSHIIAGDVTMIRPLVTDMTRVVSIRG